MRKVVELKTGRLEIEVKSAGLHLDELCGFGSRSNPKRGYLFVSRVLGKHLPVRPSVMRRVYEMLAERLVALTMENPVLAVGLAETATGFGQGVFESLRRLDPAMEGLYLHTTRYRVGSGRALRFEEEHCHASEHILHEPCGAEERELFRGARTLVLLDDEVSTGKTFLNLAKTLLEDRSTLRRVVLVTITNWLGEGRREDFSTCLPCAVDWVTLLEGEFRFTPAGSLHADVSARSVGNGEPKDGILGGNFGRFGFQSSRGVDWAGYAEGLNLAPEDKILVLGTGEFTFFPFKLAEFLEGQGYDVHFQSTTRSPILMDGDIRSRLKFEDNYFDGIDNFLYNVRREDYSRILVCYETSPLPPGHDPVERLGAQSVFFRAFATKASVDQDKGLS